jgi:HD-GYP domain-containing protein (c-di-GMP phosphodiesterase class II)
MDIQPADRPEAAAERRIRVTFAFDESCIASTAALRALLATLYGQEPDALAHAQRVAEMSLRIGRELVLTDAQLGDLERAAWLHDLGKIVLPEVQRVTSPSVDGDALRWTEQVLVADEIIRRTPFLCAAADIVLASRECIDGSGYPNHLAGSAIAVGARILSVADTFDALSAMCLSLGVDPAAVHVELVRHAGSRFDPHVVAACLRSC